jgi:hypothetical protein
MLDMALEEDRGKQQTQGGIYEEQICS